MTSEIISALHNNINEQWRPLIGYESIYDISSFGKIRNHKKILSLKKCGKYGHLLVNLTKDSKPKLYLIHRLVAENFISHQPANKPYVLHSDGNPANNKVSNLRWGTLKENGEDSVRHGRTLRGTKHPNSKLDDCKILEIREMIREGHSHRVVAEKFKVTRGAISQIHRGEAWGWL